MNVATLRCHSQLLARYKGSLLTLTMMFSTHTKVYQELSSLSSLPHVAKYKGFFPQYLFNPMGTLN